MCRQPHRRFCPSPFLLFCLFATSHDLEFSLTPQIFLRVHLICFVSQLYNSTELAMSLSACAKYFTQISFQKARSSFLHNLRLFAAQSNCQKIKVSSHSSSPFAFIGISFFQRRFCDDDDGDLLLHFYVDNIFTVLTSRGP